MRSALALVLVMACFPVAAQQVYRCKGSNGETVYSQQPCSKEATAITVRGTRAATVSDAEHANRQAVYQSTDLSGAGINERNCIASANESIYRPSNERIAGYERQVSALNNELGLARNNLAGATYASGIRSQMASLQSSIAAERSSADAQMGSARARCADERRREEEAIREKYRAPTAPTR